MKKIILLFLLSGLQPGLLSAQTTIILSNGFDNYNGLPATVAPGWYYSYNDTASVTKSFYNTSGYFGLTSPAYKFGFDSVTVISPAFSNADSLAFWMKGNGTVKDSNTFEVYTSPDSLVWNLLISMDSISPTAANLSLPVPSTATHLKFFYRKYVSGYNVGLDDIFVLRNGVGITENHPGDAVTVYPSPTHGEITVSMKDASRAEVTLYDLLGNRVSGIIPAVRNNQYIMLNLGGHRPGFYFLRIKTGKGVYTRRITLE